MAKIIIDDEEAEVTDGSKIVDQIEEMGVPVGCSSGVCGTCEITIEEGMENLNERTDEEKDLGIEGNNRLGCQCIIKGGSVRLTY